MTFSRSKLFGRNPMAAIRKLLTDAQWAKIAPLLPSEKPGSQGGRPPAPNREVLGGCLDPRSSPRHFWRRKIQIFGPLILQEIIAA